jgi:uncharacterized protein (TIGR03437 family)
MRFPVAALVLAAPVFAQCTYTLDKTIVSVPSTATATNTINVTVSDPRCQWLPNVDTGFNWLHIPAAQQVVMTGPGSFTFSVDANPLGVARGGSIHVLNSSGTNVVVNVNQDPAVCNFALTPSSQNVGVAGGSGAAVVTANCAWALSSNVGWIGIPANNGGGLTGTTVTFSVSANGCIGGRSGTIFLNGSSLATPLTSTVTQDGSASNFSLSATSASMDATAGDGRFTVNTGAGCGWNAASDVSWLQLTAGGSGSGLGAIAYHVLANSSGAVRTGNIHVNASPTAKFTYTVTQAAAGPPLPTIAAVDNAANYAGSAVSPGEIVTLFGTNLGPTPLVPLQVTNGALTTTLGGTQVLFDGVAAPMIYSFSQQVSAVAPYSLAGKTSTQVQVAYNGATSAALTMAVQPSTPALFTLDASGLGPGAILNQDNSINSVSLPAARGSIVAIYCTGGGATTPATADGAVISAPPPRLALTVSVTIGGLDAPVSYSGAVPGSIAGLTQINAQVPAGITPGNTVPVIVKIGGVASTGGVTMAVK